MATKKAFEIVEEALKNTDGSLFSVTRYLEDRFTERVRGWKDSRVSVVWSEMKRCGLEKVSDVKFVIEMIKEGRKLKKRKEHKEKKASVC